MILLIERCPERRALVRAWLGRSRWRDQVLLHADRPGDAIQKARSQGLRAVLLSGDQAGLADFLEGGAPVLIYGAVPEDLRRDLSEAGVAQFTGRYPLRALDELLAPPLRRAA